MPSAITTDTTQHVTTTVTSPHATVRRASIKTLSRNVDKVVLGNLLFDTWYYSPYPDSIILGQDPQAAPTTKHAPDIKNGDAHQHRSTVSTAPSQAANGISASSDKPSCPCLHVCPYCFRYSPSFPEYSIHLKLHLEAERNNAEFFVPVPSTAMKVYSHDGYTVYDVDGEVEKLYCQNLSLFGKLFLEQKSVFYDTAGFHYFVLTYTPPAEVVAAAHPSPTTSSKAGRGRGRKRRSSSLKDSTSGATTMANDPVLKTQVLGFFSKENLSWDSNNLACILVFPPFQHRNLGQLLMAISYKLSGWEWEDSIIGGPEKPLSTMGRRSYLRFWSERIARYMMGYSWDADGRTVFDGVRRRKAGHRKEEMTVREIGERTGMLEEDVVAALVEMGICEAAPQRKKKKASTDADDRHQDTAEADHGMAMLVQRTKVLEWVKERQVDLVSPVKEEGFLGEWALSEIRSTSSEESKEEVDDSQDE